MDMEENWLLSLTAASSFTGFHGRFYMRFEGISIIMLTVHALSSFFVKNTQRCSPNSVYTVGVLAVSLMTGCDVCGLGAGSAAIIGLAMSDPHSKEEFRALQVRRNKAFLEIGRGRLKLGPRSLLLCGRPCKK